MGKWAGWYRLHTIFFKVLFFFFFTFIYFWLCSVLSLWGISLAVVSGLLSGCSRWAACFDGLSDRGAQAVGAKASVAVAAGSGLEAPGPWSPGLVAVAQGLGRSAACETVPDQALTLSLPRGRAVLRHWATRDSAMQFSFVSLKLDHLSYLQNTCLKPTDGIQIPNILHTLFHTGVWFCNTFNLKFKGSYCLALVHIVSWAYLVCS